MTFENTKWEVSGSRLLDLERKEKELIRAKALIVRLRAKNTAMAKEHFLAFEKMQERYNRLTSFSHKYGAKIVMAVFKKSTI